MNIVSSKRILLYGDSLVYGKIPGSSSRYIASERFSGVMQEYLGVSYEVIEEGLRARTLSGENNLFPERDGLVQFGPIFGSHTPLDLVVIFLGTNDCNSYSNKSILDWESAMSSYMEKLKVWNGQLNIKSTPKIIFVVPPRIQQQELEKDVVMLKIFGSDAERKSELMSKAMEGFCTKYAVSFFDAGSVCKTAVDEGVHLDKENNRQLGVSLAEYSLKVLNEKSHAKSKSKSAGF